MPRWTMTLNNLVNSLTISFYKTKRNKYFDLSILQEKWDCQKQCLSEVNEHLKRRSRNPSFLEFILPIKAQFLSLTCSSGSRATFGEVTAKIWVACNSKLITNNFHGHIFPHKPSLGMMEKEETFRLIKKHL